MTVTELLDAIQALVDSGALDAASPVSTEGCDCYGDVALLEVSKQEKSPTGQVLFLQRS